MKNKKTALILAGALFFGHNFSFAKNLKNLFGVSGNVFYYCNVLVI